MKVNLYFNDRDENNRFVTSCNSEEVMSNIYKYVEKLNKNFKIYYVRSWEKNGKTWYDVGSHSEFFFTEKVNNSGS